MIRTTFKPIVTEKSSTLMQLNKYVFEVSNYINKIELKKDIEAYFSVKVADINSMTRKGKKKRVGRFEGVKKDTKRIIVTLKEGSKIEIFEKVGSES